MDINDFLLQNRANLFFYPPELIPPAIPEDIKAELLLGINMDYNLIEFFKDPTQLRVQNIGGRDLVIVGTYVAGIYLMGIDVNTKEVCGCDTQKDIAGYNASRRLGPGSCWAPPASGR